MPITFDLIKNSKEIQTYLKHVDNYFAGIGYKEHGIMHATFTAERAAYILQQLRYTKRNQELAKIAGYLHDIGNIVAKKGHSQSGALMIMHLLKNMKLSDEKYNTDFFKIFGAIGSHEDKNMIPPTEIAAAVVLGDKTDVRYERLRGNEEKLKDVHSKVIAACKESKITVSKDDKEIILHLTINTNICSIMEYFEIFTTRTIFCSKASNVLGCNFSLFINGDKFL